MIKLKLNIDQMSLETDEAKYNKLALDDTSLVMSDGQYVLSFTEAKYQNSGAPLLALENTLDVDSHGYSKYVISPFLGCDNDIDIIYDNANPIDVEFECNIGGNFL